MPLGLRLISSISQMDWCNRRPLMASRSFLWESTIDWAVCLVNPVPAASWMLTEDPVFGYATNKALRDAKQTNAGLRDQRAAFECGYLSISERALDGNLNWNYRGS